MKIFSIRNVLAVAAVYGANQYAKKNGGWRTAAQGLLDKVREAANQRPGVVAGAGGMGESPRAMGAAPGTAAGTGAASYAGIGSRSVGAGGREPSARGVGGEASGYGTGGVGRGGSTGSAGSSTSGSAGTSGASGTSGSSGNGGRRT